MPRVGEGLTPMDLHLLPDSLCNYLEEREETWWEFADRCKVDRLAIIDLCLAGHPLSVDDLERVLVTIANDPMPEFSGREHTLLGVTKDDFRHTFATIAKELKVDRRTAETAFVQAIKKLRRQKQTGGAVTKLGRILDLTPRFMSSLRVRQFVEWGWDDDDAKQKPGRVLMRDGVKMNEEQAVAKRTLRHRDHTWLEARKGTAK